MLSILFLFTHKNFILDSIDQKIEKIIFSHFQINTNFW